MKEIFPYIEEGIEYSKKFIEYHRDLSRYSDPKPSSIFCEGYPNVSYGFGWVSYICRLYQLGIKFKFPPFKSKDDFIDQLMITWMEYTNNRGFDPNLAAVWGNAISGRVNP